MQGWIDDRPVLDGGSREDGVHRQHVLDEHQVGVVVGQVSERDEARKQRDGRDEGGLGAADDDHGILQETGYLANSAIASSASTPPVIEIGANAALAATSALDSMI